MNILSLASSNSVERGYEYFESKRILSCEQIDNQIYRGTVLGSGNSIYNVELNLKDPYSSNCDCPYAEGTRIFCKHKVALYFYLFPEEAKEYEDWLYSDSEFYGEDEEWEYEDEDDYYQYGINKTVPYCYDELLEEYINRMSIDELKSFVRNELNKDKYETFSYKLKDEYAKYLKNNADYEFVERLHSDLSHICENHDYNYTNYDTELISEEDKERIGTIYGKNPQNDMLLDKTLLNPTLAEYTGFEWILNFYKNHLSEEQKSQFSEELNNTFNQLKYYGIKNTECKSNILISLFMLNDYSTEFLAESLIHNCKYIEYIEYVIDHTDRKVDLYNKTIKIFENGMITNRKGSVKVLKVFYEHLNKKDQLRKKVMADFSYYDFLLNNERNSLQYLIRNNEQEYLKNIKYKLIKPEQLAVYYDCTKQYELLYGIVVKENRQYLYNKYLDVLKISYNDELFQYYRNNMYQLLEKGMGREIYREALDNIKYIKRLRNGDNLVCSIYSELRNNKYSNRPALFDEFRKVWGDCIPSQNRYNLY